MGVMAEIQQLHSLDGERQHQEVLWWWRCFVDLGRVLRAGLERLARLRPGPQRPSARGELFPVVAAMVGVLRDGTQCDLAAEPVLLAGLRQQPADLHGRLARELSGLAAASIGVKQHAAMPVPASEHQGADPWRSIRCHGGQLQPAGCR